MSENQDKVFNLMVEYYKKQTRHTIDYLHLIIQNNNIDDDDILFCFKECHKHKNLLGQKFCLAFQKLSILERQAVLDRYWNRVDKRDFKDRMVKK